MACLSIERHFYPDLCIAETVTVYEDLCVDTVCIRDIVLTDRKFAVNDLRQGFPIPLSFINKGQFNVAVIPGLPLLPLPAAPLSGLLPLLLSAILLLSLPLLPRGSRLLPAPCPRSASFGARGLFEGIYGLYTSVPGKSSILLSPLASLPVPLPLLFTRPELPASLPSCPSVPGEAEGLELFTACVMAAARYAGYLHTLRPIVLPHTDPVCYSKPRGCRKR